MEVVLYSGNELREGGQSFIGCKEEEGGTFVFLLVAIVIYIYDIILRKYSLIDCINEHKIIYEHGEGA